MAVPETAMHKNDFATGCKYQIGFAWQVLAVQPVAETHGVGHEPHRYFGFGVFAFHRLHCAAAGSGNLHQARLIAVNLDSRTMVSSRLMRVLRIVSAPLCSISKPT